MKVSPKFLLWFFGFNFSHTTLVYIFLKSQKIRWVEISIWISSLLLPINGLRKQYFKTTRLLCPWNSPGKDTGVDSHSLLLGIFQSQGSNPGLLHCRWILYHLSYQGSPIYSLSEFCWSEVWKDVTGFSAHKSDQHVLPIWIGWYWPCHGSDHLWWGAALMVSCSSGIIFIDLNSITHDFFQLTWKKVA